MRLLRGIFLILSTCWFGHLGTARIAPQSSVILWGGMPWLLCYKRCRDKRSCLVSSWWNARSPSSYEHRCRCAVRWRSIVTATLASVIVGGVLIRFLAPAEFANVGIGLWCALQTVTTVGYGDVTPQNAIGRVVGAIIMLESIAFVAIVTAAIIKFRGTGSPGTDHTGRSRGAPSYRAAGGRTRRHQGTT